ncbi:MAG: hypothetical protein BWY17_05023 [Deltaproteobacteria bacterium ADurb.Bin207]|jgi:hypothetical protein|nr:MAG: hypothetical protein BWY17_05023 [Deltaproteobacteria bacterium ADurb.Bin207]
MVIARAGAVPRGSDFDRGPMFRFLSHAHPGCQFGIIDQLSQVRTSSGSRRGGGVMAVKTEPGRIHGVNAIGRQTHASPPLLAAHNPLPCTPSQQLRHEQDRVEAHLWVRIACLGDGGKDTKSPAATRTLQRIYVEHSAKKRRPVQSRPRRRHGPAIASLRLGAPRL